MASCIILNASNVIGNNNSQFQYNFQNGSFTVLPGAELSINQVQLPYAWFNVTNSLGNNTFQYIMPTSGTFNVTASSSGTTLAVTVVPSSGKILVGDTITISATPYTIVSYISGQGGVGTYQLSASVTAGSASYTFSRTNNTYTVTLPNGFYTLNDIQSALNKSLLANGFYFYSTTQPSTSGNANPSIIYPITFSTNAPQYTNQITLNYLPTSSADVTSMFGSGYIWANSYITGSLTTPQIVIPAGVKSTTTLFGNLIGFQSGTYPSAAQSIYPANAVIGGYTVTISGNSLSATPPFPPLGSYINSVLVHCNLVDNKVGSGGFQDVLDVIPITSTFGSNISYLPIANAGVRLRPGKYSNLIITLTDSNNNPIQSNDPNALMNFVLTMPQT